MVDSPFVRGTMEAASANAARRATRAIAELTGADMVLRRKKSVDVVVVVAAAGLYVAGAVVRFWSSS